MILSIFYLKIIIEDIAQISLYSVFENADTPMY